MSKENIPTLEEYISQQIAAKRKAALDKSRNRTSIRVPMIPNELSYEEERKSLARKIEYLEELLSADVAKGVRMDHPDILDMIRELNDLVERYYRKKEGNLTPGPNCMYNAGDCYGLNIPGNKTFATKHKELGFQKVSNGPMEPGDLVQDIRYGLPVHALIYDGKNGDNPLFNYARGFHNSDMESNYVKQGKYPFHEGYDVYKYVGTPQDSARWVNEYKQIYGLGKGGIIGIHYHKKGSGIHIKKKNRGKFTEYCGGKVTDECISRAKKSKNPKLRKRATFAANARKWKHEEGGSVHKPNGHRSILDNGWIPTKRLKKGTYGLIKKK